MAHENLLYQAIFVLFLGFLTFIGSIMNKINSYLEFVDNYFVIFLFTGVATSIIGIIMVLIWHFRNRSPFVEEQRKKDTGHSFVPFFGLGVLFVLIGFTVIHYLKDLSQATYIISMTSSIMGILFMLNGLRYFLKEVVFKKKSAPHSGN